MYSAKSPAGLARAYITHTQKVITDVLTYMLEVNRISTLP